MKKLFLLALFFIFCLSSFTMHSQNAYWVFLTDKQGATFDPYAYFDAKAIERYNVCGADLYDITNYPVSALYEQGVGALATEEIGASRWMNALGIMATPEQISAIEALPYVLRVQPIDGTGLQLTRAIKQSNNQAIEPLDGLFDIAHVDGPLEAQLVRMGGQHFREAGIDGKGVRIAVFDGGFPQVNTHAAFKHLRDNHQILKTWNFPKDKEDVYGWNSHGTMTLSCIAGRYYSGTDTVDLGLATGAEFLLARTEVNSEPFKEEVWWQMAVEWADRNGANIISSSLGYGKERHYTTDMDGTSYVAKAGNLAARKGMLVVNSAGNEATDSQWKTIITPADADSVLCVGGIENSLTEYNHIEFSSYGPSADGRLKPNVCAFGYARTANTGKGDNKYHYVHGTSFSCPLVAGFAACAWQASLGKTAMEMFHMIEQSADLYPYADYSFGYGVPQADFFTSGAKKIEPTFRFVMEEDSVRVVPTHPIKHANLFYAFRHPSNNHLLYYGKMKVDYADGNDFFTFSKNAIYSRTLIVCMAGYADSLKLSSGEYEKYAGNCNYVYWPEASKQAVTSNLTGRKGDISTSKWGSNNTWRYNVYFGLGLPVKFDDNELTSNVWSPSWNFGARLLRAFSKAYCLGMSLDFNFTHYRHNGLSVNDLESSLGIAQASLDAFKEVDTRSLVFSEVALELFQRVRLLPGGIMGNGLHWDLGVYGSFGTNSYTLSGTLPKGSPADEVSTTYSGMDALSAHTWNFGVTTRLCNDWYGFYARYRLNGIGQDPAAGKVLLPRLTVGLQLQF